MSDFPSSTEMAEAIAADCELYAKVHGSNMIVVADDWRPGGLERVEPRDTLLKAAETIRSLIKSPGKWDEGEHEGCGIDSQRAYERQSRAAAQPSTQPVCDLCDAALMCAACGHEQRPVRAQQSVPHDELTIDGVPSCGQENDYRRAAQAKQEPAFDKNAVALHVRAEQGQGERGELAGIIKREAKEWLATGLIDESDKRAVTSFTNWLMKVVAAPQPIGNANWETFRDILVNHSLGGNDPAAYCPGEMIEQVAREIAAACGGVAYTAHNAAIEQAAKIADNNGWEATAAQIRALAIPSTDRGAGA